MTQTARPIPEILCIGAVLWDVIGASRAPMAPGDDVPGRIVRRPGGVALNVAAALARAGRRPVLLGAMGTDAEGRTLSALCAGMGIDTGHLHRSALAPTDRYIAIEAANGLVGAIADLAALEAAGRAVLAPLEDGRLGAPDRPFAGIAVIDGNLPEPLLAEIAGGAALASADLRLAPASPAKARRLAPLIGDPRVTLYLNRAEAGRLLGRVFAGARDAARALRAAGVARVLVTDGAAPAAFASEAETLVRPAAPVVPARVTGAGDALMAAHVAAEAAGAGPESAFEAALAAAACHVAAEPVA